MKVYKIYNEFGVKFKNYYISESLANNAIDSIDWESKTGKTIDELSSEGLVYYEEIDINLNDNKNEEKVRAAFMLFEYYNIVDNLNKHLYTIDIIPTEYFSLSYCSDIICIKYSNHILYRSDEDSAELSKVEEFVKLEFNKLLDNMTNYKFK